jgi:branched-chain amino acid transport system permease protein
MNALALPPPLQRSKLVAIAIAMGCVLLALVPLFSGNYFLSFATEVLIFAIFAMSLDILLGYTGLMSFGHAAFFGLGAYTVVLLGAKYGLSLWLGLLAGIAVAAIGAVVIGFFCVRVKGIPFLMLTMAFAQLIYSVAVKWRDFTGGSDGVGGVVRPSLLSFSLDSPELMYLLILAFFVATYFLLRHLVDSPLGKSFVGIRENEMRMRAMGYPTVKYKLLSFVVSGAVAGMAGGLYAFFNEYISPDAVHWSASGDVLVMVTLGGAGTLVGPILGVITFLGLKYFVSSTTQHWTLIIGIIFIFSVTYFPHGIYGAIRSLRWSAK